MSIDVSGAFKSYQTTQGVNRLLNDFSCHIPAGSRVALLGRNGSGKSTFIRATAQAEPLDQGSIIVTGSVSWPVALSSGFAPALTGEQNCEFVLRCYGLDRSERTRALKWIEQFAAIGSYFKEPVKQYSSGMRSRVSFALSMALDFDWLLIDEITAVGDSEFKAKCATALDSRCANRSVMFVSHTLAEVVHRCNCAILFDKSLPAGAHFYTDLRVAVTHYKDLMAQGNTS